MYRPTVQGPYRGMQNRNPPVEDSGFVPYSITIREAGNHASPITSRR